MLLILRFRRLLLLPVLNTSPGYELIIPPTCFCNRNLDMSPNGSKGKSILHYAPQTADCRRISAVPMPAADAVPHRVGYMGTGMCSPPVPSSGVSTLPYASPL